MSAGISREFKAKVQPFAVSGLISDRIASKWKHSSAVVRMMPMGLLGHCINVTIVAFSLSTAVPTLPLFGWTLLAYLSAAMLIVKPYKGSRTVSRLRILRGTARGIVLSLPWSVLGTWLLGSVPHNEEMVVIAVCLGMAASGSVMMASVAFAASAYMLTILIPLTAKCFYIHDNAYYSFAALLICYMAFLENCIWTCHRLIKDRKKATHDLQVSLEQTERANAELKVVATIDPLTALPNRNHALVLLQDAIHRAAAETTQDIDRFKRVNDSLGHACGDELLRLAALRLMRHLKNSDIVARIGGDEFLIVLENLSGPENAEAVANRIIQRLEDPFILETGHEVFVGASVGMSLFPADSTDAKHLLEQADAALYQAKKAGGGTMFRYGSHLTEAANWRLEMEAGLKRAFERDEFHLAFQPIIQLEGDRLLGFEALARWNSPERGSIPPDVFIPCAEESGLILALGDWVMLEACRKAEAWIKAGYPLEMIAVNVSTRQFMQPDFVQRVQSVLARSGLAPWRLAIELTESALMADIPATEQKLEALKRWGVKIAVDDFGTGYSSLAYLKNFAIDKLKIDRSFIKDIPGETKSCEITAAIVSLGRSLKLEIVAEGVETRQQLNYLKSHHCSAAQGYFFSKPMTLNDAEAWMAKRMAGAQENHNT